MRGDIGLHGRDRANKIRGAARVALNKTCRVRRALAPPRHAYILKLYDILKQYTESRSWARRPVASAGRRDDCCPGN